jgi:hypothetical protein
MARWVNAIHARTIPGTTEHEKRGEGGWTLKRGFIQGINKAKVY